MSSTTVAEVEAMPTLGLNLKTGTDMWDTKGAQTPKHCEHLSTGKVQIKVQIYSIYMRYTVYIL